MFDHKFIYQQIQEAFLGLLDVAKLKPQNIFLIGCSTSEIVGKKIGSATNTDIAKLILSAIQPHLEQLGIFLAIQCCEHLNRSLVVTEECAQLYNLEEVSVIPQLHAGGALATLAMDEFTNPIVVEKIVAHAGMDIGDTFIGMHLKRVVVPVRLLIKQIGQAHLTLARTRPPLVGGERAKYAASANIK